MIVRIDDVNKPKELNEVWSQPLAQVSLEGLGAGHSLDGLEEQVTEVGWALMRQLIVEQWRLTDQALVRAYQEPHRGTWVTADGYDELQVVGRFGVIQLPRQVCYNSKAACHVLPGNTALPLHRGQVTTRGLQEWVCLLPQGGSVLILLGYNFKETGDRNDSLFLEGGSTMVLEPVECPVC